MGKFEKKADFQASERRFRRHWKPVTAILSCIVAIATVWALVAPGITLISGADPVVNPADNQPGKLAVTYYLYVDDALAANDGWVAVGSTNTGMQGVEGHTDGTQYDRISYDQLYSVYGAYGFPESGATAEGQLYYQDGWYLTTPKCSTQDWLTLGGTQWLRLTAHYDDPTVGACVYWCPAGTSDSAASYTSETALAGKLNNNSKFVEVTVNDPFNLVYTDEELAEAGLPSTQYVCKGDTLTLTLKRRNAAGTVMNWRQATCWQQKQSGLGTSTTSEDGNYVTYSFSVTNPMRITPENTSVNTQLSASEQAYDTSNTRTKVTWYVYLNDAWTAVGLTQGIFYSAEDWAPSFSDGSPRLFVTTEIAQSVLGKYGFDAGSYTYTSGASGFAYNRAENNTFYVNATPTLMGDGKTWTIPLGNATSGNAQSTDHYNVYWMPGLQGKLPADFDLEKWGDVTISGRNNVPSAWMDGGSRIYTVCVRDIKHLVYDEAELSKLVEYVPEGGSTTVTVSRIAKDAENLGHVIWSLYNHANVKPTENGNLATFAIENVSSELWVTATYDTPQFQVQYYANMDRYVLGSSGTLAVIDTSGGKLPTNTTATPPLKYLTLEGTGVNTTQNAGDAAERHNVKTEKVVTKLYSSAQYYYSPNLKVSEMDRLYGSGGYALSQIWISKDGCSPEDGSVANWYVYNVGTDTDVITFTNAAAYVTATDNTTGEACCILLRPEDTVRFVYETTSSNHLQSVDLHDYDISMVDRTNYSTAFNSDGTAKYYYTYPKTTANSGINSSNNYKSPLNFSYVTGTDLTGVYAFGNNNTGTGVAGALWNGVSLNKYSGQGLITEKGEDGNHGRAVYAGCTFGLVSSVSAKGVLEWSAGVKAPARLFSKPNANDIGHYYYPNSTLTFVREGDRYTLSKVANSTAGTVSNLQYLFHPSPTEGLTYDKIWTNGFWPMDTIANTTYKLNQDGRFGAYNSTKNFIGYYSADNKIGSKMTVNEELPASDDGRDHNSYFGMNYRVDFSLTADYVGPMEYLFFGDDDMWVFLVDDTTGKSTLVCDIGGIHSSVGQYVNLRDYLPEGTAGTYTLYFFFTERGASGSTCWMSFILPSLTEPTTGDNLGNLTISKNVTAENDVDMNASMLNAGTEYTFEVHLHDGGEDGDPISGTFSVIRENPNAETVYETYHVTKEEHTMKIRPGDTVTILGLPEGTWYEVTELDADGYFVTVSGSSGTIVANETVSGSIVAESENSASFVNKMMSALPSTGGIGTYIYTFGGYALILIALVAYFIIRKRETAAE